jgi:hypothetical protein
MASFPGHLPGLQGCEALRQYLNAALLPAEFQVVIKVLDFEQSGFRFRSEMLNMGILLA